ncbi:hypothetical protein GCM10009588_03960 [Microbacterium phyllosphaerae]
MVRTLSPATLRDEIRAECSFDAREIGECEPGIRGAVLYRALPRHCCVDDGENRCRPSTVTVTLLNTYAGQSTDQFWTSVTMTSPLYELSPFNRQHLQSQVQEPGGRP